MKFSKSSIIHSFLFAIFPIFYLYSINFIEVSINEIIFPILISMLVTSIFLVISKLILKDWIKAGLVVSLVLILSFSYGHIYNLLDTSMLGEYEIIRHRYLLPLFLAVLIIGIILIVKTKINLDKLKTISNAIAITLIVVTIPNLAYAEIPTFETNEDVQLQNHEIMYGLKNTEILNSKEKFDVYYIILDGYGGTKRMNEDLMFDNYGFLSELTNRGFFAPDTSSSNYPSTAWSVASSLNMNYLPIQGKDQSNTEYAFLINQLNNKNEVMRNFDYLDYEIIHHKTYSVFSENPLFVDKIICEKNNSNSKFNNVLLRTTILGYFTNQLSLEGDRQTILCAFSEISNLNAKTDKPLFAFIHLLIPHPPYLFGENGENVISGKTQTIEGSFVDEEGYVNSIKFINKKIIENVDNILTNNKNSIIIIQSDHGYDFGINYENPSELNLKQRFSIINSIYMPDENKNFLYEGMTPVNTFRIIFNSYFGTSYEILEDKMFYSPYGVNLIYQNIEFRDVTEIILN